MAAAVTIPMLKATTTNSMDIKKSDQKRIYVHDMNDDPKYLSIKWIYGGVIYARKFICKVVQ